MAQNLELLAAKELQIETLKGVVQNHASEISEKEKTIKSKWFGTACDDF